MNREDLLMRAEEAVWFKCASYCVLPEWNARQALKIITIYSIIHKKCCFWQARGMHIRNSSFLWKLGFFFSKVYFIYIGKNHKHQWKELNLHIMLIVGQESTFSVSDLHWLVQMLRISLIRRVIWKVVNSGKKATNAFVTGNTTFQKYISGLAKLQFSWISQKRSQKKWFL